MYFNTKEIGIVGFLSGERYKTEFNTFVMKKPDYNTTMMSTFLGSTVSGVQK